MTVSDSRTFADDKSGDYLADAVRQAGHELAQRYLIADDLYPLRALVASLIAGQGDSQLAKQAVEEKRGAAQVILITGGTGFGVRDLTPEAVAPLLDRQIPGFGEMFRVLSSEEIGPATMQSRALAGLANGKFVCCMPGSPGACRTAWERLLRQQLDSDSKPCNFTTSID